MPEPIAVRIDGVRCEVGAGTSVAAAVLNHAGPSFRRSVIGQPRGPLCGMGTCFECRVTIDGLPHERSCNIECRSGMDIRTAAEGVRR